MARSRKSRESSRGCGGARPKLLLAIAVAAVAGCGGAALPPAMRQGVAPDAFARIPLPEVAFDGAVPADAPRRIVSMIPSATELLFALGLGDRVVGRSDWCDWPPEATTRPALGSQHSMSLERVADARPDLVVFWAHLPDKTAKMTGLFGLNVVTPGTESRLEIEDGIRAVARACKVPSRGDALVRRLADGLTALRVRHAASRRPRTLVVLDRGQSYFVPGRDSFLHEILDVAGAENVAASLQAGRWPSVSIEQILDWDPELILDLSLPAGAGGAEVAAAHGFWARHAALRAVREGRVIALSSGVLVRPGPRMLGVAEELAKVIHGAP